jgi:hypothetical protein
VLSTVYRVKFAIDDVIEDSSESELAKVTKQTFYLSASSKLVARAHEAAEEKHEGATKQQGKDKKNDMRWKRRKEWWPTGHSWHSTISLQQKMEGIYY